MSAARSRVLGGNYRYRLGAAHFDLDKLEKSVEPHDAGIVDDTVEYRVGGTVVDENYLPLTLGTGAFWGTGTPTFRNIDLRRLVRMN